MGKAFMGKSHHVLANISQTSSLRGQKLAGAANQELSKRYLMNACNDEAFQVYLTVNKGQ